MASTKNADRQSPDDDERAARATRTAMDPRRTVRQFREILLWPLQLHAATSGTLKPEIGILLLRS